MQSAKVRALLGGPCLCLALVLSSEAVAQSPNSRDSSPEEKAQTQQLNQGITDSNAAATKQDDQNNAQYQAEQQRYHEELQQYRTHVRNYEEKAAHYEAERGHYIAADARYHRAGWPSRYEHRLIVDTRDLLGARVRTYDGRTVGHVEEVALSSGHVDALRVALGPDRGDVWIELADLRFDSESRVVLTDLDRRDLYEMARETY